MGLESARLDPPEAKLVVISHDGVCYEMGQWDRPHSQDELDAHTHLIVFDARKPGLEYYWSATAGRGEVPPPKT
ncbi:hypothetical protein [Thioalkalivibrio sp.]|uniref:hypothetical protein n=1 Tax=Thioalkalivibrio sp. TaxID=2093813 RepID=UPI0035680589